MFLVGLSGGIASGKSTVVAILQELGCAVIDADAIARQGEFSVASCPFFAAEVCRRWKTASVDH